MTKGTTLMTSTSKDMRGLVYSDPVDKKWRIIKQLQKTDDKRREGDRSKNVQIRINVRREEYNNQKVLPSLLVFGPP